MNSGRLIAATVSALMAMTYLALSISAGAHSKQEPVILDSPAGTDEIAELGELRSAGLKEYNLGHFAEAQRLLESAMALAMQASDTYVVALIHGSLGVVYHDEYEFTKAEQEFKKAVDILRLQPEHSHALAMTLANFGAALCGDRRYREASTLLSEASKLVTKNALEDPQLQVHILDVSATVHIHERQFKKAEALLLHAFRISSLPKNATITEAADVSNNLATLYAAQGNYQKAVSSYTRAMDIAEKRFGATSPNIATILDNLGFAYIHIGRYDEAEPQFTRSLAILEANGLMAGPMGINTLYGLAATSVEKNQLDRAQSLLARAVQTGRTIRARTPEMADTLELYSTVLKRLSRSPEAENLHTEAALIRTELALTTRAGQ